MKMTDKERLPASVISDILSGGLELNDATLGYMASTFGEATPEMLQSIIQDQANCEKDTFLELIFFPDEVCQIQLEDMLITEQVTDQDKVVQHLEQMIDHVEIRFPRDMRKIRVAFTPDLAEQFVSRLRIWNNPDPELEHAVRENVQPERIGPVLVRLRNADIQRSPHIIRFLCHFFAKMDSGEQDYLNYVDFLIRFSSTLHDTIDIFKALMERKKSCLDAVEKAVAYEKQLTRYNMEVMILKGARNPCISIEDAERTITIINRIAFTLFGRSDYPEACRQEVDLGVCRKNDDLQRVIRRMS